MKLKSNKIEDEEVKKQRSLKIRSFSRYGKKPEILSKLNLSWRLDRPSPNQTAGGSSSSIKAATEQHQLEWELKTRKQKTLSLYMHISPHNLGPVPEDLHADVAGPVRLRRDVDLAELGLFGG